MQTERLSPNEWHFRSFHLEIFISKWSIFFLYCINCCHCGTAILSFLIFVIPFRPDWAVGNVTAEKKGCWKLLKDFILNVLPPSLCQQKDSQYCYHSCLPIRYPCWVMSSLHEKYEPPNAGSWVKNVRCVPSLVDSPAFMMKRWRFKVSLPFSCLKIWISSAIKWP